MEEKKMDKLFREACKDAEETPPSAIWSKITAQLDDECENIVVLPAKLNKAWVSYVAAAAILLAGSVSFFFMKNTNETNVPQTASTNTTPHTTESTSADRISDIPTATEEKENSIISPPIGTIQLEERPKTAVQVAKTNDTPTQLMDKEDQPISPPIPVEQEVPQIAQKVSPHTPLREPTKEVPVRRVTEIEDIKPLIESEDDESSMLASVGQLREKNSVVTSVLNTITSNIESDKAKDIRFSVDDEGSIKINLFNTIVRNRTKNKK